MEINSDFECGNIIVNELSDTEALLSIRPDTGANYYQWFYFRVTGTPDTTRTFRITNAAGASYEKAWNGYRVLASYNGNDWLRIPTEYDGSNLTFKHSATESTTSYAFFVPYFAAQRETLLHDCESSPLVTRRSIGKSYQGKSIDMVVIGDENRDTKRIWVITRQHAGESMAEWATEGMLRRFIDANDSVSQALLSKATIYVVPNINPDGSALGNLRANAAGVDLNRAWAEPTDKCPEIIAVQKAMKEVGVDYFLDMHGDEERPFIWIAHTDVEQSPEQKRLQAQFEQELVDRNPEILPAPEELRGEIANMGLATNYMASTFNCLSWITELPFREPEIIEDNPDSMLPDGCLRFGRTCVDALNEVV